MQRCPANAQQGAATGRASRRKLDEASKLLFVADVVADAIRIAVPDIAALLRLDTIRPLPTEYVAQERTKRFGDAAFRVKLRKGRFPTTRGSRRGRRLYLLLPTEFQHRNDAGMAQRARGYVVEMVAHYRHQGLIRDDEHPPVLALVIHTGGGRWSADDGAEVFRALPENAATRLARYQPLAYIPLDVGRQTTLDVPVGSRLAAVAALTRCDTARELAACLADQWRRFGGADNAPVRRGMLAWAEEAVLGFPDSGFELPSFDELEGHEENEMAYLLEDRVKQWQADWLDEGIRKGRKEGLEEGREEGQRDLLEALVASRFGATAARRLSIALNGSPSQTRIAELGDLILASATAEEFLARLDG